jgi:chromosome transmission fidelity protein 1
LNQSKGNLHNLIDNDNSTPILSAPVPVPVEAVAQPTILEAGVGVNPILPVLTFIKMLVCHSESGRIVCRSGQQQSSIKFLLLNPGSMFHDVVSKSRAVILAGGTMKPTWDVRHELFNNSERIEEHSFQHVVPPENVLPLVLSKAPTGNCIFDFSYESRGNRGMVCD